VARFVPRRLGDEVTLYNRVLSATDIADIYAADSAGKCAQVLAR